jgi:ribosomal protein L32
MANAAAAVIITLRRLIGIPYALAKCGGFDPGLSICTKCGGFDPGLSDCAKCGGFDPGLSICAKCGGFDPGLSICAKCGGFDPGLSICTKCGGFDPGLSLRAKAGPVTAQHAAIATRLSFMVWIPFCETSGHANRRNTAVPITYKRRENRNSLMRD